MADKEQNSLAQRSRRTQRFPTQTPSMQCPKRKRVADVELGIQVIKEVQPAILQRTAVGFNLSKSKSVKPRFRKFEICRVKRGRFSHQATKILFFT